MKMTSEEESDDGLDQVLDVDNNELSEPPTEQESNRMVAYKKLRNAARNIKMHLNKCDRKDAVCIRNSAFSIAIQALCSSQRNVHTDFESNIQEALDLLAVAAKNVLDRMGSSNTANADLIHRMIDHYTPNNIAINALCEVERIRIAEARSRSQAANNGGHVNKTQITKDSEENGEARTEDQNENEDVFHQVFGPEVKDDDK